MILKGFFCINILVIELYKVEEINGSDFEHGEPQQPNSGFFNSKMALRQTKLDQKIKVGRDIKSHFRKLFDLVFKIFDGFDEKVISNEIYHKARNPNFKYQRSINNTP